MSLIGRTEADLQEAIHTIYESDADTPDSTDDDYVIRRNLINVAINRWENNKGVFWNELWTNTTLDSTGATLTIATNDTTYPVPTNFRFPGGYVKVYNGSTLYKTYRVVKPEQAQSLSDASEYAYFTGNPNSGIVLNLNPAPPAAMNGMTLRYDFYKYATKIAATTDVPEMGDPYYAVWAVVAELNKADNNIPLYESALAEAEERIKQMEVQNLMYANYQDWGMEDQQAINTGGGFGY